MAKKPKSSGKSSKKLSRKKPSSGTGAKPSEKHPKKAAKQQARTEAAATAKQAKADRRAAKRAAEAAPAAKPDQVTVLKLALRDTEAKLVDAEHRLRQVQQQLDDERRALAEAAAETVAEAVVDAAVAETVAEAVVEAELVVGDEDPAVVAELVAETLEEVAAEADPGPAPARELTPPLPTAPDEGVPSEEWTLVRLREEARRRGLTGVSGLSKARLVERLAQG